MKIIVGIIVTFIVAVFAIVLYPITFLMVVLIHILKARKIVASIGGYESRLEKYKTIVRPFMLINGLVFLVTSAVSFNFRVEGSAGLIYILLFVVGVFMTTKYSLNIPIENSNEDIADKPNSVIEDNSPKRKRVLYKAIPTVLSVVMCAVMAVQISNYTPPVAVIADEPANLQSISENVPREKYQVPSSEDGSSPAQEIEPTPESSMPAPETPSAHSEENGTQAAESVPPTLSDTPISNPQETESTPTPSVTPPANDGSAQGDNGGGSSSEAHFNDYDTPEHQDTKEYVLNTSTMKVHRPTCSDVKKIKPENYSTINNSADALNNGYVPCKRCSPN